jgi:hypothetical protein
MHKLRELKCVDRVEGKADTWSSIDHPLPAQYQTKQAGRYKGRKPTANEKAPAPGAAAHDVLECRGFGNLIISPHFDLPKQAETTYQTKVASALNPVPPILLARGFGKGPLEPPGGFLGNGWDTFSLATQKRSSWSA